MREREPAASSNHKNDNDQVDTMNSEMEKLTVSLGSAESMDLEDPSPTLEAMQMEFLKLIWGAGGIYTAYLYYGSLYEDVFAYVDSNGVGLKQAWFLQSLEASVNVLVGAIGLKFVGSAGKIPQKDFILSGSAQVCAKAFTSMALASGVSYPVTTLAKCAKMAPVMAGSFFLGKSVYSMREYMQVFAIILGTLIVSLAKKKGDDSSSSFVGLSLILLSLMMDGVVGGTQKRLKANMSKIGVEPKPYDFMFYTNIYMMLMGFFISFSIGEFFPGLAYCLRNPGIRSLIVKYSLCSAIGQSFIFYTIAHFDPLVCSTITTTRKILTVLISITFKGHKLGLSGWSGVGIAVAGISSEAMSKYSAAMKKKSTFND